jgi:hypothetical protein
MKKISGTIKLVSPSVEDHGQPLADALLRQMREAGWKTHDLVVLQERREES